MMTKQDFEAIAHVLDANEAPLAIVLDFADMLSEQNERFNYGLFVKASTKELTLALSHNKRMIERSIKR